MNLQPASPSEVLSQRAACQRNESGTRARRPFRLLALLLFALGLSTTASAQMHNVGDYYDDGEILYLMQSWYDPSAPTLPGPDDNFEQVFPWTGGGGGSGGFQIERAVSPHDKGSTKGSAHLLENGEPVPLPPVIVTARRRDATGGVRIYFSVDAGGVLARFFGQRPAEPLEPTEVTIEMPSNLTCSDDGSVRKPAVAAMAVAMARPTGTTITAVYADGSETWTTTCRPVGLQAITCNPTTILGGNSVPESVTGNCN